MIRGLLFLAVAILAFGAPVAYAQTDQPTTEPPATETPAAEPEEAISTLAVDAKLCTAIVDRQPEGTGDSFAPDVDQVYLWSKITGAADSTTVTHVWMYEGKEMAVVELPVKSPSWRTWTSKTILPEWTGRWEVRVVDAEGVVMATVGFTIGETTAPEPAQTP